MVLPPNANSALFTPLRIANGAIELKHRVVLAPMTRNRGLPCTPDDPKEPVRTWYPDELVERYYAQRASEGGLLITEGIAPNQQGGGMPGTTGLWRPDHVSGWQAVVEAVHRKGGYICAQLWHQGRTTISPMTGLPAVSPSGLPWDNPEERYNYPIAGSRGEGERPKFVDYPPIEMSVDMIKQTIEDYCDAAERAIQECGFDMIEVHGANGYLPEQFLSSNVNVRTDRYGGTPEKRCTFVIELMEALAKRVGEEKVSIRLSPFGFYNQARGQQRLETWGHLCRELKEKLPRISYVSFVEPRYEQVLSVEEKDNFLKSWGFSSVDLSPFREIFGETPFFTAGGFNDSNVWGVIESKKYDAVAIGRFFTSNPDLPRRIWEGKPLQKYERDRFYGPFEDRERGYTDYKP